MKPIGAIVWRRWTCGFRAPSTWERNQLQTLAEAFSLFNRANVDEVFSVYGAPNVVGPVPQHYGDGIINVNPGFPFGTPRTTFNPRRIQLAVKFTI